MLSVDQLSVSVVNHFIYYLVYKHEVFTDALFVENTHVVSKHFHHAVDNFEHTRRLNIVFCSRYKVNAKLLGEEVVDSINILNMDCQGGIKLTNAGGGSPGQNLTFLKKTSVVCRPNSYLTAPNISLKITYSLS